MGKYNLKPMDVPKVSTKYRTVKTKLPVPESLEIFKSLMQSEPASMSRLAPIVWDKAEGFQVSDKWGNKWIDWSSGIMIANVGHGRKKIREALENQLKKPLLSTYIFVHEERVVLTRALQALSPDPPNYQVYLLSTGSEAIESSIKIARTHAWDKYGPKKKYLVSFRHAFHGRTLGAQLAGGMDRQKKWIVDEGKTFIQVPFPDGYKNEDTSFGLFLRSIEAQNVKPDEIAGVLIESYQAVGPDFVPYEYAQNLQSFCREHDIVTIFDEVQAGFGRSGKMFTYEHYDVKPDLITCGKGLSSSLPISAVIGRKDLMNLPSLGSMSSTHSASPLPVAAAVANLKILQRENLVENARKLGEILIPELKRIQGKYPDVFGCVHGKGLIAGIQVVRKGTKEPDPDTAFKINEKCFQKGLLMFAPVGVVGECIKIAPPLMMNEEVLRESIAVLEEACEEVLGT